MFKIANFWTVCLVLFFSGISTSKSEETLFTRYGLRVFVDDDFHLSCTGCRPGDDSRKLVISTEIGAGLYPQGEIGSVLFLQENRGTSCPAGGWHALPLQPPLRIIKIEPKSCNDIEKIELSEQNGRVTLILTHYRGVKTQTSIQSRP